MPEPKHRAQRLIGDIPKHRAGGLKPTQKAIFHLSKPAAFHDEVSNAPLTGRAMARQAGTKLAGAAAHVGMMVALGKSARTGHDAFEITEVSKAKHRGLSPVGQASAKVDSEVRARLVPKGQRKRPAPAAALRHGVPGAHARGVQAIDDTLGWVAPVSPKQDMYGRMGNIAGHVAHHLLVH